MYEMGISLLLSLVMMCGSGGNVAQAEITPWEPSAIYTEEEILEAVGVAEAYFAKEFEGCTLRELLMQAMTIRMNSQNGQKLMKRRKPLCLYLLSMWTLPAVMVP